MKKITLCIFCILIFALSSCSSSQDKTYSLYFTDDSVIINNFSIVINSIHSKIISKDVSNMEFSIYVYNISEKDLDYKIENLKLIRNKTNESFSVNKDFPENYIYINAKSSIIINFNSTVKRSSDYSNYTLSYNSDNTKMNINLFQKSKENVEVYRIDYIFNEEERGYSFSNSNEKFRAKGIVYDDIYYNDIWYTDRLMKKKFIDDYIICDTVLYGKSIPIMIYKNDANGLLYVDGINKVPENNRIIVPKEFEQKKILGLYLDGNQAENIASLYIPKGLELITIINFPNLKKILFEGSKE